ncbi:MAG: septum formation initiator family protein [Lentisphaeria bacterium]|nr:septum formation initiator family protein [Lentisphaeria bacterium]
MSNKVQKMLSVTFWVIIVLLLIFSAFVVMPVYRKYVVMQKKVYSLEQELKEAQEECQALLREVNDLEHSSLAAERVAREKYRLSDEGEKILYFQ